MRTLKVYGDKKDTNYTVYINNELYKDNNEPYIYSFKTETSLHDSYNIKISVSKGTLVLKNCLVDYPALINKKESKVTFEQPIETPMYKWSEGELIPQPFDITITTGETVEFEQLMFNGPSYLDVKISNDVQYDDSLYIGNLLKMKFIPGILGITPVYEYSKESNTVWSKEDLKQLEDKVISRLLNK